MTWLFDGCVTPAIRKIHDSCGFFGRMDKPGAASDNQGWSAGAGMAMKILLVEDDTQIADHVAEALGTAGLDVETFGDGNEGLEAAQSGKYAALILDRMLPGMDGLTITKSLRARGVETPILLLTTMTGIDDRVEGLEGGADDYLV